MAGIVPSLFGPTPEELMSLQRREQAQTITQAGQLYGPRGASGAAIGTLLARGANKLFGLEDPEVKKATDVYNILRTTQQELGAGATDPTILYPTLQKNFAEAGYGDIAEKVSQEGATKILDWQTKQADIAKKKDELEREQGFNAELKQAQINKGDTPLTPDEIAKIGLKYGTRKDILDWAKSEDYRNLLIDNKTKDLELKYLRESGKMTDKEKLDYQNKLAKELKTFEANLKGNDQEYKTYDTLEEKLNDVNYGVGKNVRAREQTVARRVTTDAKEVTKGLDNLLTLTSGGMKDITGTTFANVKDNGFLSATAKAFSKPIENKESQMYDAVMYPIVKAMTLYANPDYRPTESDVINGMKSYKAASGDPHEVQLAKLAELKKNFIAASESFLDNHMLNAPQAKSIKQQIKEVQKAIPFEYKDVIDYSRYKDKATVPFNKFLSSKQSGGGSIPQGAIDKLKANPNLAADFDAMFGAGASKNILGR